MPGEVIQDSIIKNKAATKSLWEQRMRNDMENKKLAEVNENQKLIRKTSFKWKYQTGQSQSLDLDEQLPTQSHCTVSLLKVSTRDNEIPQNLLKINPSPTSLFAAKESAFNRKLLEMAKSHEALKIEFEKLVQKNQEILLKLKASLEENALLKIKLKECEENYQNQLNKYPAASSSIIAVKIEKPDLPMVMKSNNFGERKALKRAKPDFLNPSEPVEVEAEPSKRAKINRSNSVKDKISIFEQVKQSNIVDRSQSFRAGSVKGRFPLKIMQNSPLQE